MSSVLDTNSITPIKPPSPQAKGVPHGIVEPLFAFGDASVIVLMALLGNVVYRSLTLHDLSFIETADDSIGLGLVAALAYTLAAHHLGLHRLPAVLRRERDSGRVLVSWVFAILAVTVVLFLLKAGASVSRGSVICFAVLGGVALLVWRRFAKKRVRVALLRGIIRGRRGLLVGTQAELAAFGKHELLVSFGVDEVDRVVIPASDVTSSRRDRDVADTVIARSRATAADEVVLAMPWTNAAGVEVLLQQLRVSPLPVRLLPDRAVSTVLKLETVPHRSSLSIEVQRAPLNAFERVSKRLLDVGCATFALVLFAPVMAAAAIAVKLETPGPVVFRQRRHGFNGRSFRIYKFRTMQVTEDGAVVPQVQKRDPRVTRVGRFLRQTSIDELPQFINVLRGDMSIVGPRPHAIAHDDAYGSMIANYAFRHHMKPGITGWAQVHGCRGATPRLEMMERRVDLDIWYINNWSVWLDIQIMVWTAFQLARDPNAY